jgi:ElaA protein
VIRFIQKSFDDLSKEELYAILKLRMEIFILEQHSFYLDLDDQDQYAIHIFGVEENPVEPICYGRITTKKATAYIRRVCVCKDYREKGIGVLLMNQLLSRIDSLAVDSIELDAQIYLQNFYSKFGFCTIGQPYDDGGIMHIMMKKITK